MYEGYIIEPDPKGYKITSPNGKFFAYVSSRVVAKAAIDSYLMSVRWRNPLKAGYSRKTIGANIKHMVRKGRKGRKVKAEVAAALSKARATFKKRYPGRALPGFLRPKRAHNAAKRRTSARVRRDIGSVRAAHLLKAMGGSSKKGHVLYVARKPLGVIYGEKDARLVARIVAQHCGLKVQVGGKK